MKDKPTAFEYFVKNVRSYLQKGIHVTEIIRLFIERGATISSVGVKRVLNAFEEQGLLSRDIETIFRDHKIA